MAQNLFPLAQLQSLFPTLKNRYDRCAQDWHQAISRLGYLEAYTDLIEVARPRLTPSQTPTKLKVLDAGAGSGGFSQALCQSLARPMRIDLLDISPQMLTTASQNLKRFDHPVHTICAPVEELDTTGAHYDLILCAHVIEHCADPAASLGHLRHALAPDGLILFAVSKPHWCTALVQLRWHNRTYRPAKFTKLLQTAGFADISTRFFSQGPPKFTSCGYLARAR